MLYVLQQTCKNFPPLPSRPLFGPLDVAGFHYIIDVGNVYMINDMYLAVWLPNV